MKNEGTLKDRVITGYFEFLIFKNAEGWYVDAMVRRDASIFRKWTTGKTKKAVMSAIDRMR